MRRRVAFLLGIALVAGCAGTNRGGDADLAVAQARKAVDACHQRRVPQYDNGRSNPHEIALAVARACEQEWMSLVKLIRPVGRRTPYMVGWYHQMTLQQRRQAAQAVVLVRARQRQGSPAVVQAGTR